MSIVLGLSKNSRLDIWMHVYVHIFIHIIYLLISCESNSCLTPETLKSMKLLIHNPACPHSSKSVKKSGRFLKSHWSLIKNGYPEQLVHISVKETAAAAATGKAALQQKERSRQEWQPSKKDDLFLLPKSLHMNCCQKPLLTHVEGLIKTNYYNIHLSLINLTL